MSEMIKHECGLAVIRLLKPLSYYQEKYGSSLYGLNQLQLLLQKQRNRGQDGAGMASIKLDIQPGRRYISIKRSNDPQYLKDLFAQVFWHFKDLPPDQLNDSEWLKANKPYMGELLLGHLRYGTHGSNSLDSVHPFLRPSNWKSRNLLLAGNFNLTNIDVLFEELVQLGQYPKEKADTVTVLEKIGHFLDEEVERLYHYHKVESRSISEINQSIFANLNVERILMRACKKFDGGFVIAGLIGHGDAFIIRDQSGIRPAFYYCDDEVVVVASERPAIQTAFKVKWHEIREIDHGHALIIKKDGTIKHTQVMDQREKKACSFERIYFSRGTDRDIYLERKQLGKNLAGPVLDLIDYDFENTVFSFIPNTAEAAYLGLQEEILKAADLHKEKLLEEAPQKQWPQILKMQPRFEKMVVKDAKMRTFIADDVVRSDMVSHVYDVTYGIIKNQKDTLVLIDDSIVRGTTMRDSIIRSVDRLHPKKIIILSSAPQIRYPDCYGIDMSRLGEFVAFRALIALIKENNMEQHLEEAYLKSKAANKPGDIKNEQENYVKQLYDFFTNKEITNKIAELLTPPDIEAEVEVIYQTIEGLQKACPGHRGDWYFTGNYPTPGGYRVVNRSFRYFMENRLERAYV